jgi:hypothetical protein
LIVSTLAVTATRLPTRSRYLNGWDGVNFALAMDRFDLGEHRPHPPGHVGYVIGGRLVRLLAKDDNTALVTWNILSAIAAAVLLYSLSYLAAPGHKSRHGWIAWVILISSPQFWFYTDVAEIYVSELLTTLLVAYCSIRLLRGEQAYMYGTAAALALCGAFKITAMVFIAPLAAISWARAPVKHKWRGLALFVFLLGLWAVPLLWWANPATYFSLLREQFAAASESTSVITSGSLVALNRNLRDVAKSLVIGIGLGSTISVLPYLLLSRHRILPSRRLISFGLLWGAPYLLFFILVHIAKPGYTLPLLPIGCLLIAFWYGQEHRRSIVIALLALQVVLGAWHFGWARPVTGVLSGEGLEYREKSWSQKLLTELNVLFIPTYHSIRSKDRDISWVVEIVQKECGEHKGTVVVTDHGLLNWRQSMYYLPNAISIGADSFLIASEKEFERSNSRVLEVEETCKTFWILPDTSSMMEKLKTQYQVRAVQDKERRLFWTTGPVSLSVNDKLLRVK